MNTSRSIYVAVAVARPATTHYTSHNYMNEEPRVWRLFKRKWTMFLVDCTSTQNIRKIMINNVCKKRELIPVSLYSHIATY